jgi:hypothetical protein
VPIAAKIYDQYTTYLVARHVGYNIKQNNTFRVYQVFQVYLPIYYTIFEGNKIFDTPQPRLYASHHITKGGIVKHPLGEVYIQAKNEPHKVILGKYNPGGYNKLNDITLAGVLDGNNNMPSNSSVRDYLVNFIENNYPKMIDNFKNGRLGNFETRAIRDYSLRMSCEEVD